MPRNTRNFSGLRIKEARRLRQLTQEQLAARLTMVAIELDVLTGWAPSRDIVERWEGGEKVVTDYQLRLLAAALQVDARWLIGDPAGAPPHKLR